ncbi:adenosylmethionine--8-amino-7-oxononanoate transaminase [Kytococcus schroeteri]|uniref:adenosylmethionine--8-amino-7-oxononanoate transaminase n=1 Tax=Kytococcus schroeteri TaxID=138300 RepID=UPI001EDEF9A4|nr:adenosylmethionine--8-amino-7-oxononanoate transaminase [Kytococcus schroeteri]
MTRSTDAAARDAAVLWHPYSRRSGAVPPREVVGAQGCRLHLADGSTPLDAMSSWWCMVHGYRHPRLDAAVHAQVDRFSHVMFGGLTHAPAVELAERLVAMTPEPLRHVFLADSGSVSVEVALKICAQVQLGRGRTGRHRMLTVAGGYHGDTLAPMGVCDPDNGMHAMFRGVLTEHVFAPRPPIWAPTSLAAGAGWGTQAASPSADAALASWAAETRRIAAEHAHELAGIVVEPVLQGAGGMRAYDPRALHVLREIADEHGLVLVLDEIATAFGRTGTLFGADHAAGVDPEGRPVVPDVLCVGKALTGGYLSLAAVVATDEVAAAVDATGALMHGPTFMGNPLACAAANASLDLLAEGEWRTQVPCIEAGLQQHLAPALDLPTVRDVRVLGAVGVLETTAPVDLPALTEAALRRGVWVRPFGTLVYTMPPYVATPEEVATIATGLVEAVSETVTEAGPR